PRRRSGQHASVEIEAAVVAGAPDHRVAGHVLHGAALVRTARLQRAQSLLRVLEEKDAGRAVLEDERVLLLQPADLLSREPQGPGALLGRERLQVAQHGVDDAGEEPEASHAEEDVEELPPGRALRWRWHGPTCRANERRRRDRRPAPAGACPCTAPCPRSYPAASLRRGWRSSSARRSPSSARRPWSCPGCPACCPARGPPFRPAPGRPAPFASHPGPICGPGSAATPRETTTMPSAAGAAAALLDAWLIFLLLVFAGAARFGAVPGVVSSLARLRYRT